MRPMMQTCGYCHLTLPVDEFIGQRRVCTACWPLALQDARMQVLTFPDSDPFYAVASMGEIAGRAARIGGPVERRYSWKTW